MLKAITNKIDPAVYFDLFPNWLFINIHRGTTHFILDSEEIIIQPQLDLPLLDYKELLVQTQIICLQIAPPFLPQCPQAGWLSLPAEQEACMPDCF